MWGVALEKTMLTYFEVDPHSRFERHSHDRAAFSWEARSFEAI